MTRETCSQFLDFLIREIAGVLAQRTISDEAVMQVSNEIGDFEEKVAASQLPPAVKQKVAGFSFHYTSAQVARGTLLQVAAVMSPGAVGRLLARRRSRERQDKLNAWCSESGRLRMVLLMAQ